MLLDAVTCVGTESNVLECGSTGQIGDTQCAHPRAAAVSCQRETSKANNPSTNQFCIENWFSEKCYVVVRDFSFK